MTDVHRGATIFAGFLTLFESVIWVVLSIIFVAAYSCNFEVPHDENAQTSFSIIYVTYFYGPCRGSRNLPPHIYRTYIWMLIYAVLSACWIPVSVLLIVGGVNKVRGKTGACFYYPWLILTSIIHIFDLVGTVIYGIDISRTLTSRDYTDFMKPLVINNGSGLDGITSLPAIELTLFCCRAVILWVINFILIGVVIQAVLGVISLPPRNQDINYNRNITKEATPGRWVNARSGEPVDLNNPKNKVEGRRGNSWELERKHPWVITDPQRNIEGARGRDDYYMGWVDDGSSRENTPPAQPRVFNVDGSPMGDTPLHNRKQLRNVNIETRDAGGRPWSYTHGDMGAAMKPRQDPREPDPDYTVHPQTPRRYPSVLTPRNDFPQEYIQRPREKRSGAGAF